MSIGFHLMLMLAGNGAPIARIDEVCHGSIRRGVSASLVLTPTILITCQIAEIDRADGVAVDAGNGPVISKSSQQWGYTQRYINMALAAPSLALLTLTFCLGIAGSSQR